MFIFQDSASFDLDEDPNEVTANASGGGKQRADSSNEEGTD